ncbi:MAG: HAD family hydrolase [Lentisphaeria bacterium]
MTLIAFDFDGVICASASETGASAWRGAAKIWPKEFKDCPEASPERIQKFCQVRPALETGYQAILMAKMIKDGYPKEDFQNHFLDIAHKMMAEQQLTTEMLAKLFGEMRDQWIEHDLAGWLNVHDFYPGVIDAFQKLVKKHDVVILTTKQERFVKLLLENQGVDFPKERIYGLERKRKKEDWLLQFQNEGKKDIHFIEDRLGTLLRVKEIPELSGVHLHYADWGYGTAAELVQVKQDERILLLTLKQLTSLHFLDE